MLLREKAKAEVILYDRDAMSVLTKQGWMSYDSVYRCWPDFVRSKYKSDGTIGYSDEDGEETLVLINELKGCIVKPYVQVTDSNFLVYSTNGNWVPRFNDNDAWGTYYEVNTYSKSSVWLYDSTVTKNLYYDNPSIGSNPCFGIRLRRYEPSAGVPRDYRSWKKAPYTWIQFGGIWAVYIPYSGASQLMKCVDGIWGAVKTLSYTPDSKSMSEAADVLVMHLDGKIVITCDWFTTSDVYEEGTPITVKGTAIGVTQNGGRAQVAIRRLDFYQYGSYITIRRPVFPRSDSSILGSIEFTLREWPTAGSRNSILSHVINNPKYGTGPNGSLIYEVKVFPNSIVYGVLMTVPPVFSTYSPANHCHLEADTYRIELDEPKEVENTRATVSLNTLKRVTYDGLKKFEYAHSIVDDGGDFKGLSSYMFAGVKLGFTRRDPATGVLYDAGVGANTWDREFYGLVKDPSGSLSENSDFNFSIASAIVNYQETMCDGFWGPYDGLYVIEAMENVSQECGIPSDRILVKALVAGLGDIVGTVQWVPISTVVAQLGTTTFANAWTKMLAKLDVHGGKDPKWKPRAGDNGWQVMQSLAEYEHGLLMVDGLYVYYDPFYYNGVYPSAYKDPGTGKWRVGKSVSITLSTMVKNFKTTETNDSDYCIVSPVDEAVNSEALAGTVAAVGQAVYMGGRRAIVVEIQNPLANDNTSPLFIPFIKRGVISNPMWDSFQLVANVARTMADYSFQLVRVYNLTTYGHPGIKPRQYVSYSDYSLEGSSGQGTAASVIEIESGRHVWSGKDKVAWAESTFTGPQVGRVGGNKWDVKK
jgi:hypothetical protein